MTLPVRIEEKMTDDSRHGFYTAFPPCFCNKWIRFGKALRVSYTFCLTLLFYRSCISRLYKLASETCSFSSQSHIKHLQKTMKDSHSFHSNFIHHTVIIIITGTFYSEIRRPVEADQLPPNLSTSGASQNTQALPARHLIQTKITNLIGRVSRETAVLKY